MSDIKVKLERLKRERSSRDRAKSGRVEDLWTEIDKEKGLTTKEKLEQLISLQKDFSGDRPVKPQRAQSSSESYRRLENVYAQDARYGRIRISEGLGIKGEILKCMSHEQAYQTLDLSSAVFVDLETTGLSGGAGTVPFLIGLGYYCEDQFRVVQYFLDELGGEGEMLEDLDRFLEAMAFQSVVTYNGKVFDIPLLESRFILNRKQLALSRLPHLDFLFPARRLWSHKVENCRLYNLALELIKTERSEDIPSAEIPWRYFQYIQTGAYDLVEPIIYHNAEDILSLLGIIILGASIFSEDQDLCELDGLDYFGAGKVMESFGDKEKSLHFFRKSLENDPSGEVSLSVRRRISHSHKKENDWDRAVRQWEEMADTEHVNRDTLYSLRELAMYYEHRAKDLEKAKKYAEEGLVASTGVSSFYEIDFQKRNQRLLEKMKRQTGKKGVDS